MKKYVNNSFITKSPSEYKNGTAAVTNLPVTIYTDGQPVSSYTLKGNTSVSGTPSPSSPVTISGVGNETANLLDYSFFATTRYVTVTPITNGVNLTGTYFAEINITLEVGTTYYMTWDENAISGSIYVCWRLQYTDDTYSTLTRSGVALTPAKEIAKVLFYVNSTNTQASVDITNIMLNTGTAPLPYEPYGKYKISILKGLTPLTPMYFSQQLYKINDTVDTENSSGTATYNCGIYKVTGNENWYMHGSIASWFFADNLFAPVIPDVSANIDMITSHYIVKPYASATGLNNGECTVGHPNGTLSINRLIFKDTRYTTVEDFTDWLKAQYANGTPVTIYYARATPTTESVTAPEITTTGGTATIDVDTTVKPSEMSLTYHGWHSHEPLKYVWQNLSPKASFTNNSTDSRDFFKPQIRTRYENVEQQVINFDNISATGKVELSFTINTENDYLRFQHSGASRNIIIFEMDGLSEGQYTLSFTVGGYNPSTAGGLILSEIELKTISGQWE